MKRTIALACCTVLVFALAGCKPAAESTSEAAPAPASSSLSAEQPAEQPVASSAAVQPESTGGLADPAVASAEDLIKPAMEVYGWFALGTMPLGSESKTAVNPATGAEDYYQQVDSPNFSTYAEMEAYLGQFFSEELVRQLLEEYPLCQDIDGALYMVPAGRGADIFVKDVAYSTDEVTDTTAHLTASVTYDPDANEPENPKNYSFVCEKVDGKWVFTTFEFYL